MRCPDCIDGPIPGCQWDYDHPTEWKMKECPTCDGTGKVSVAEVHNEQPKKPSIFESAANKQDPEDYPLANVVRPQSKQDVLREGMIGRYENFNMISFVLNHFPRSKKRRVQKKCRAMGSAWWMKYKEIQFS